MFLKLEDILFPKADHYGSNFGILKGSVVNKRGWILLSSWPKNNYYEIIKLTGNFGGFCTWLSCP